LENYKAISYPAIHQTVHSKTIYTTSAPSSGGIMLAMLNILEQYPFDNAEECFSPLGQHRLLEAMKFAFGARSEITDPAFVGDKEKKRFQEFYSKEWAEEVRGMIDDVGPTHFGWSMS
jgi:gamma-glutamyltranspeptidase/glutathione hydrolase/leukotriene-C4 hydrolase